MIDREGAVYRNMVFRTLVENRAKIEETAIAERRSLSQMVDMLVLEALARRAEMEQNNES